VVSPMSGAISIHNVCRLVVNYDQQETKKVRYFMSFCVNDLLKEAKNITCQLYNSPYMNPTQTYNSLTMHAMNY